MGINAKSLLQVNWNDTGVHPSAERECSQDLEDLFRLSVFLLAL